VFRAPLVLLAFLSLAGVAVAKGASGGPGNDRLAGSSGPDRLSGNGGNDEDPTPADRLRAEYAARTEAVRAVFRRLFSGEKTV